MVNSNRLSKHHKRPTIVTFLSFVVCLIALVNLTRIIQAISQWPFLTAVFTHAPVYQLVSGCVWVLCSLMLFWSMWFRWRKTPLFIMISSILYSVYFWIDRFVLSATPFDSNWLFILIINGLVLAIIGWSLTRRNTQAFFGEAYGTRTQNR